MIWKNKKNPLLRFSSYCASESSLGRQAIHQNHGVAACAGTQNNIKAVGG
jgi:hypothetical protein